MEFPEDPKPTEDEMIAAYVKTLTAVVGRSECFDVFLTSLGSNMAWSL